MTAIPSFNPATGVKLGEVAICTESEVRLAVQNSKMVQPVWAALSFKERSQYLLRMRRLILENIDDVAKLISQENGKPVMEALCHDIMPVMDLMTYFSKNAEKLLEKESIGLGKWSFMGHKSYLEFDPYGVVAVISPWNFPFSIPLGEIAMALIVGNTVVLKPSEYTPLIAKKIEELFKSAKLPDNVFQVVYGDGATGAALINSGIDKVAFTGSVNTGKKIMEACSKNLIPVNLELGGKDPLIVRPDADLENASSAAVWGAFANSGQVCASIERVYVHESIAGPFTDLVVKKTNELRQGKGTDVGTDIGSMTAQMQMEKVEEHVKDAIEKGARILTGGEKNAALQGMFYKPTVLTNVDHSFKIVAEETFGPVLPIMTYKTEDEAVKLANDSPYALNAYIWSGNIRKGQELASRIVAGTVNVNDSLFTHALPQTPWGGPKLSGIGRTHGIHGLMDLVRVRHVHVNTMNSKLGRFWWYGYSQNKVEMIKALCFILFGRMSEKISGAVRFAKGVFKL